MNPQLLPLHDAGAAPSPLRTIGAALALSGICLAVLVLGSDPPREPMTSILTHWPR